MKFGKHVIGILLITLPSAVFADTNSGSREIQQIGCHLNDGTCYVYIDGAAVGPSQCNNTSLRWNKDSANSGTEMLSLLMAAFAAGKKVNFRVVDTCYGSYPTFSFINIYK